MRDDTEHTMGVDDRLYEQGPQGARGRRRGHDTTRPDKLSNHGMIYILHHFILDIIRV